VAFIYAGGIPILYLLAAIYFFVTYWTEKYLMMRHYVRPPKYDNYLALKTLEWFKFALFFHVIMSTFMFANTYILTDHNIHDYIQNLLKMGKDVLRIEETESTFAAHAKVYFYSLFGLALLWILIKYLILPILNIF
jgi:hypothetical protein